MTPLYVPLRVTLSVSASLKYRGRRRRGQGECAFHNVSPVDVPGASNFSRI